MKLPYLALTMFYWFLHVIMALITFLLKKIQHVYTRCIKVLYTPYISRGFYFRESGATREINNAQKIFTPKGSDPDAWMQLAYVHSARARRMILLVYGGSIDFSFIALFDREFNHSRKCRKVLIREKLDSQNIWCIHSTCPIWMKFK